MTNPFYPRRRQIAMKVEVTPGTEEALADADVIAPSYSVEYTPSVEMADRGDVVQASMSRLPMIAGERSVEMTFATELKGSGTAGTAPPQLSAPLQGCGMDETLVASTSATYGPVSEDQKSVTIEIREGSGGTDFKSVKSVGSRGTFTLTATKGQPVLVNFTFSGKYVEPTDTTAFATPSPAPAPIPFLSSAFSFQGTSLKVQEVTLDIANNVVLRNDSAEATGNSMAVIERREPTGSLNPERELVATFNAYNAWTSNTEGILTYSLTGSAGNITVVTCPKAQIQELAPGDRDGIGTDDLTISLNQSINAGDDEISIAFT